MLKIGQQAEEDVMVLQLFPEEQSLNGVVIGEQGHHVLEEEALAVGQELGGIVHLGVDVVGHDVVQVNQVGAPRFAVPQKP